MPVYKVAIAAVEASAQRQVEFARVFDLAVN